MNEPATQVFLDCPSDADLRHVGTLVLGGVAARSDVPVDRVEELGLAVDSLVRSVGEPRVHLAIASESGRLVVSIGPFELDPFEDEGVGRVVRGLVDQVASEDRDGAHWVNLGVFFSKV